MTVYTDGEFLPITAVPTILRQKYGRSPDVRTIKRWRKEGVCKGTVILRTTRIGCHVYTTHDWLNEFFAQQEVYYRALEEQKKATAAKAKSNFRGTMKIAQTSGTSAQHRASTDRLSKIFGSDD